MLVMFSDDVEIFHVVNVVLEMLKVSSFYINTQRAYACYWLSNTLKTTWFFMNNCCSFSQTGYELLSSVYRCLIDKTLHPPPSCVLKTIRQKWKHFAEMFVRTLHYHQLNSWSRLQIIIYRKFCKHNQIYSE